MKRVSHMVLAFFTFTTIAWTAPPPEPTIQTHDRRFITGRVLDDQYSLPQPGITVQIQTPLQTQTVTTNSHGLFQVYIQGTPIDVTVSTPTHVPLTRRVTGTATSQRVTDLRLTPRAEVGASPIQAPGMTVTLGAGLGGSASVTPFSDQALPALLPAGFTPAAGFELHGSQGSGTILWNVDNHLAAPAGATWLFLKQEAHGWRLITTQTAGPATQATFSHSGDGNYLTALQDPSSTMPAPVVGDLLTRDRDALIPGTALGTALTQPAQVSIKQNPVTTFSLVLKDGTVPSGSRTRVRLTEYHSPYHGEAEVRAEYLDLFAYYAGADPHTPTQGRLTVKNRIPIHETETQTAAMNFKAENDQPTPMDFPYQGFYQLGAVTLDFNQAVTQPIVVGLTPLQQNARRGLNTGEVLSAFTMLLGGDLITNPTLTIKAPAHHAAVILLRRIQGTEWSYAGRLSHNGEVWAADPAHSDLLYSGDFAVMTLSEAVTEVTGNVLDQGVPAQGVVVRGETFPWPAFTDADGAYRTLIHTAPESLTATHPQTRRSDGVTLAPTGPTLTDVDLHLDDPLFHVISHQPADGALHLPLLPEIRLTFNLPPNHDRTAAAQAVTLQAADGTQVPVNAYIKNNSTDIFVTPLTVLAPETTYTFTLSTQLTNRYGSHLSEPVDFQFQTRSQTASNLDLARFYLTHESGQLYLNAPASAFPHRTYLDALNLDTAANDSWLMQGGAPFKAPIDGTPGHAISLAATTPDGRRFEHVVTVVQTGPGMWRIGDSPFTIEIAPGQTFQCNRVRSGQGRILRFLPADETRVLNRVAQTPALAGDPFGQIHAAFTVEALDGGRIPDLEGRLLINTDVPADRVVSLMRIQTDRVMTPQQAEYLNAPKLLDTVRTAPAATAKTQLTGLAFQIGFNFQSFQHAGLFFAATYVQVAKRTTIRVNVTRNLHNTIPMPPVENPDWYYWKNQAANLGADPENWQTAPNTPVYLNRVTGGGDYLGITDEMGAVTNGFCHCTPASIYAIDPHTGQRKTSKTIAFRPGSNDLGMETGASRTNHAHFNSVFPGEPLNIQYKLIWTLERPSLLDPSIWIKDHTATAHMREHGLIRVDGPARLHLRIEAPADHHLNTQDISIQGAASQSGNFGRHWVEYRFDPQPTSQPGTLTLQVALPGMTHRRTLTLYGADPNENKPGPPKIVGFPPTDRNAPRPYLKLTASEDVQGWTEQVELLNADARPVDITLLDSALQPLADDQWAHEVYLAPNKPFNTDPRTPSMSKTSRTPTANCWTSAR